MQLLHLLKLQLKGGNRVAFMKWWVSFEGKVGLRFEGKKRGSNMATGEVVAWRLYNPVPIVKSSKGGDTDPSCSGRSLDGSGSWS